MANMDRTVTVSEVAPRDGLQIERDMVPTEDKIAMIDALSRAGISKIEATGFAHPSIVPQLSDAMDVLSGITRHPSTRYSAYAPNVKGVERALAAGADDIKAGLTASETFNRLNVRMSTADALQAFRDIADVAKSEATPIEGVIGTAFGCPYEGDVALDHVMEIAEGVVTAGASVVYFADTTGMANPSTVASTIEEARSRWPDVRFGLHLHNTRGSGIANALAGLNAGVRDFEASVGGLGGCPFAPRAVGNICTEDFVHMLHEMGFETGIDLDALIDAAKLAEGAIGRTLPGMVMKAGKASDLHDAERS